VKGKHILVGVTGGIAAYKAADLVSKLAQQGAKVTVVMTTSAQKFVSPLTFASLSAGPVYVEEFDDSGPVRHVSLAREADLVVVAPATANTLGKLAHGLADNLLTTLILAARCPVLVAPAMNAGMWANPAVQANVDLLRRRGVHIVEPEAGHLACGETGAGRLAATEKIIEACSIILGKHRADYQGVRVLVTAGATREPLDPVRFLSNRSTGRMGFAVARAAAARGAEVVLVSGPGDLLPPPGVKLIQIETALEMYQAVLQEFARTDLVVKAAAVSDYRPENFSTRKIKKGTEELHLVLKKNPDILAELGQSKTHQILVGFAAETDNLEEYARRKLEQKNLDLIVANLVGAEDRGFASDNNAVTIFSRRGEKWEYGLMPKLDLAHRILDTAAAIINSRGK